MPDPIIHVLSTRPLSPALITGAAEQGIAIDVIPFITTEAVDDAALRVAELAGRPLVVVFTSSNAVETAAGWVNEVRDWTIFCIGGATRQMVERYFGSTAIAGTAASAAALADMIIGRRGFEEVFFFCGDLRREELPAALRKAGIRVEEVVVYRTRAAARKLERSYDGILFFSPSAVESYFSLNDVAAGATLFAIGPTTAAALREHSTAEVIISETPEAAVLIKKVIGNFLK